jgi:murein DD-endopeptidase MepM/ murein hydrolase activator NlpD
MYPIKNNNLISSYYGNRQLYGITNFHNGIDIPAIYNTPVYSINSGIVKYIGFDAKGYGNYIIILHSNSIKSLYGHLSENMIVNLGDYVNNGQIISYVGPKTLSNGISNGNTTGPHLHFSVFDDIGNTIDPLNLEYKK